MEPVLRFKADDGSDFPDWEEKTLGELCAPLTYGMNAAATRFDGENRYIRITDIDDETHAYLSDDVVSPEGKLDDKYIVGNGDILLARTGASTGKSYLYHSKDGKLFYAGFLIKAHVLSSSDDYFVYSQTLTDKYWKWVKTTSMRSGQPGINATEYASYSFAVPSLPEQHKIADLLSTVDRVIAAQQTEVDAWEQRKKGVIQKLFSQEVRFKADDGSEFPDWEERTSAELCNRMIGGGTPSTSNTDNYNGDISWISSSDLDVDNITTVRRTRFITEEAIATSATKKVKPGSIAVVLRVGVGKVALLDRETCTSQDFISLEDVTGDAKFIAYMLSARMQREAVRTQGTSIKGIPATRFKELTYRMPSSIIEQRKIADLLSIVDDVIVKAKAELAKWQELKKGLLQQMFA
ncbi:restriction endonuclease subunit S [Bifidobacterium coryneforme]|uniref:Type I restriction modification DNA specificity domain-containing protein n=1 Tax=Bifidobacterium [indicum] DSM 20214 = LMG 11587 TaxID=1341694 RepID=A0A087VSH9_9BIFI|nr:restriction endonuclease subunit S [Bifidobacterium indicum]AIC91299.1 Type I restriction-modification system specificity (S) subunit of unknown recognition sequence [Bifidobacterium indicum LMG 11587 = DSM 20214]